MAAAKKTLGIRTAGVQSPAGNELFDFKVLRSVG